MKESLAKLFHLVKTKQYTSATSYLESLQGFYAVSLREAEIAKVFYSLDQFKDPLHVLQISPKDPSPNLLHIIARTKFDKPITQKCREFLTKLMEMDTFNLALAMVDEFYKTPFCSAIIHENFEIAEIFFDVYKKFMSNARVKLNLLHLMKTGEVSEQFSSIALEWFLKLLPMARFFDTENEVEEYIELAQRQQSACQNKSYHEQIIQLFKTIKKVPYIDPELPQMNFTPLTVPLKTIKAADVEKEKQTASSNKEKLPETNSKSPKEEIKNPGPTEKTKTPEANSTLTSDSSQPKRKGSWLSSHIPIFRKNSTSRKQPSSSNLRSFVNQGSSLQRSISQESASSEDSDISQGEILASPPLSPSSSIESDLHTVGNSGMPPTEPKSSRFKLFKLKNKKEQRDLKHLPSSNLQPRRHSVDSTNPDLAALNGKTLASPVLPASSSVDSGLNTLAATPGSTTTVLQILKNTPKSDPSISNPTPDENLEVEAASDSSTSSFDTAESKTIEPALETTSLPQCENQPPSP